MRVGRFIILAIILILLFSDTAVASSAVPQAITVAQITGRTVIGHAQTYNLSCEARSASDLANYWGITIDEKEFQARLPRSDNPEVGFVGDPNGIWGKIPPQPYGVHAAPVAALLREYGLPAKAYRGMDWGDVQREIAAGRPVIVWIIGQMWGGKRVRYTASDGRVVKVANYEHTMIVVGYDQKTIEAVDAFNGRKGRYKIANFLRSWGVLGNMGVVISWESAKSPTSADPAPPQRTTVKAKGKPAEQNKKVYLTVIMQAYTGQEKPPAPQATPRWYPPVDHESYRVLPPFPVFW